MKKPKFLLLIIFGGLALAGCGIMKLQRTSSMVNALYVSTDGRDDQVGSTRRPFATLERARDEIRALKRQGRISSRGLTVWIAPGNYVRERPLELTAEDSGTTGAPIVWRASQAVAAKLTGGRRLENFQPVTDPAILARISESARGQVVRCDLRQAGIEDFGTIQSRGFGRPITPAHCELFIDGQPMTAARWPNTGEWEKIAGYPVPGSDPNDAELGGLTEGFFYSSDRPARWRDTKDLWVHGYWGYDWANSYEKVEKLDLATRFIKTAPPHGLYGFRKGQRFYFLNILDELDQPGEWFLDHQSGMLYLWPPETAAEESQNGAKNPGREVVLSVLAQPLLKLDDVSHVTFQGLAMEAVRGNGVEIRRGDGVRLAGCRIRNIGNNAVTVEGGHGHGVVGCDVFDTGDGGVMLKGGDRQTLAPGGHFVENCHFARQGRWSKCYVPAIGLDGVGLRVSRNLIHDHPHCAILFWGNEMLIEGNEIHHVATETGDVGAIYTGRDYTFRGNRIRGNYLHDIGGVGMGAIGVYMDDCVSGTEIENNIFFRIHYGITLGGGRDFLVRNNIFADCEAAIWMDGRALDPHPVWRSNTEICRKRLAEVPQNLYRERYPALKALDQYFGPPEGPAITGEAFKGVPPEGVVIERNICSGNWLKILWFATPEMPRVENNWTQGNPGWVGQLGRTMRAEDFTLDPKGPACTAGFQPLALDRIGLYRDELRAALTPPPPLPPSIYRGDYCEGSGDTRILQLIDDSFRFFHPDAATPNLAMLYQADWDTFTEGFGWGGWWIQNSYGFAYCATPFLQEPWLGLLQRSLDLHWNNQGDGRRMGKWGRPEEPVHTLVAPDGCLGDCATPDTIVYKQGDSRVDIHDWFWEGTAAGVVMQAELLLRSRDREALAHYMPCMHRACEAIETRRDPRNGLFLVGPASNLLAPSFGGVLQPDGSFGKAYLAGLSITYTAALERMVELFKLTGNTEKLALYERRLAITRKSLALLQTHEGYFIKSLETDGTRHGVVGQGRFGYFEGVANADALCFRVTDDANARKIYSKIAALPELRPFDWLLTNSSCLDDTYWDYGGTNLGDHINQFGDWVNGGVWGTVEGRAIMGYYRLNRFADVQASAERAMKWAKDFRMDAPWCQRGENIRNWWSDKTTNATSVMIDNFAIPAATIRGLFEWIYKADRLVVYPHVPDSIGYYRQHEPVWFGGKRITVACANGPGGIGEVLLNGKPMPVEGKDHFVLRFEDLPPQAHVEIMMNGALPPPAVLAGSPTPAGPERPMMIKDLPKPLERSFAVLTAMDRLLAEEPGADQERAFVREALAAIRAWNLRKSVNPGPGFFRPFTPERRKDVEALYERAAADLYRGFASRMERYAASGDPRKEHLGRLFRQAGGGENFPETNGD